MQNPRGARLVLGRVGGDVHRRPAPPAPPGPGSLQLAAGFWSARPHAVLPHGHHGPRDRVGAAACGDDDEAPTPDAAANPAALTDSGAGSDSGAGNDAGSGCLDRSFFYGTELDSLWTPLDLYCSAARSCPPDFATARAELADAIADDQGRGLCHCRVHIISGCGVDTIEKLCSVGAVQMNFDHDAGALIGLANRNDHSLGSPPCQYIEINAGRAKPRCPDATIESPCPQDERDQ
jgi:hypothetical protein